MVKNLENEMETEIICRVIGDTPNIPLNKPYNNPLCNAPLRSLDCSSASSFWGS